MGGAGCGSSSVSSVTSPSVVQRCQTTVSALTPAFGPNGGTGTVTVGAPRECPWTASTQAGWITIMPPGSGQGDGNVAFRVGENPDPIPRQGNQSFDRHRETENYDRRQAVACFSLRRISPILAGLKIVDVLRQRGAISTIGQRRVLKKWFRRGGSIHPIRRTRFLPGRTAAAAAARDR